MNMIEISGPIAFWIGVGIFWFGVFIGALFNDLLRWRHDKLRSEV